MFNSCKITLHAGRVVQALIQESSEWASAPLTYRGFRHLCDMEWALKGDLGTSMTWNGPLSALQIQEQSVPRLKFTSGKLLPVNLGTCLVMDILHHIPKPQWCGRLCSSWGVRELEQFSISLVGETHDPDTHFVPQFVSKLLLQFFRLRSLGLSDC